MFRLLGWLIGITLGALISAGLLIFTETGNSLLKPLAEQALQYTLPQAHITQLDIRPDHAHISLQLNPNTTANIDAVTDWWAMKAQGNWQAKTADLTTLEPLTHAPLSGPASSQGQFSWLGQSGMIDGTVNLVLSRIHVNIQKTIDQPLRIISKGNLLLNEMMPLLRQPQLTTGHATIDGQFTLTDPAQLDTLNGTCDINILDGVAKATPIQTLTAIALPQDAPFTLNARVDILNGNSTSQATLNSDMIRLTIHDAFYRLGAQSINAKHSTILPDLQKLTFLTKTPLYGRMQIDGQAEWVMPTKHLTATATSHTLGGKIDLSLNDANLRAQLHDLQTTEISALLGTPKVFQSSIKGDLAYHLTQQSGKFDATLYDGQLLPNEFSRLINTAAKFDITREVYERVRLDGDIQGSSIVANLDMKSRLTRLNSQGAKLDFARQTIDAIVTTDIQGISVPINIQGALTNPAINADLSKALGKQAEQALEKEKQKLGDQLQQQLQKALPAGIPFGR